MNQNPDAVLAALIKTELDAFRAFNQVLQQEQSALTDGDVDQLLQLVTHKSEVYEKLAELSSQRNKIVSAAGCENNASGIAVYFDSIEANPSTRELWGKLLELARETEHINNTNGILINTRLRHNQQTLSVLQNAANPSASLYGPNGQISGGASGRRLDKA